MKIMAIGTVKHPLTLEEQTEHMHKEVPETLQLYLDGKIEQFWLRDGAKGVIFLLQTESINEATALLHSLPLVRANLMSFELLPVGPLLPLAILIQSWGTGTADVPAFN